MIMIALCNDYHFWGLEIAGSNDDDPDLDEDVSEYPCADKLEGSFWTDDSVSKQLGLLECLQHWDPWSLPTQDLIDKFEMVGPSSGQGMQGAALLKARQFAIFHLTREQDAYEDAMFTGLIIMRWLIEIVSQPGPMINNHDLAASWDW